MSAPMPSIPTFLGAIAARARCVRAGDRQPGALPIGDALVFFSPVLALAVRVFTDWSSIVSLCRKRIQGI